MYYTIGTWKPIACSKCGSFKAVKPLNERQVEIRCLDCGHEKHAPPPPSAAQGGTTSWTMPPEDKEPTF